MDAKNKLYFGDNLKILREYVPEATVDLIYLDPACRQAGRRSTPAPRLSLGAVSESRTAPPTTSSSRKRAAKNPPRRSRFLRIAGNGAGRQRP
jgi:hypothetical protein